MRDHTNMACCACSRVIFDPIREDGGLCCDECGAEFVRRAAYDAAVAERDRAATLLGEWEIRSARERAERDRLRGAADDALSGWRYIRATHGDLSGVGWDRVENALAAALAGEVKP